MMFGMGEGSKNTLMETRTKASINTVKRMERAFISGRQAGRFTMESGSGACAVDSGSGESQEETTTSDSGRKTKLMAMECTPGLTEIDTKASGKCVSNTAKALRNSLMEKFTQANTKTASPMARESTPGPTATHLKAGSKTV